MIDGTRVEGGRASPGERKEAMSEKYDVVVIGAGLGGVVCAALLAKEGLNVLILDKNSRPGGKQMGFESKGFKYEMWYAPFWMLIVLGMV